jgi:hypothetical protein
MNRGSTRPSSPSTSPPLADTLTILDTHGRNVVGLWENVFLSIWRESPTPDRLRRIAVLQDEVARRFPRGFVSLAMLPNLRLTLTAETRAEAERVAARAPQSLNAIAIVTEGRGFLAAAVRSVATCVSMVLPGKRPLRIFGGQEPAVAWLATYLDRDVRATAPRLLMAAIRRTVG